MSRELWSLSSVYWTLPISVEWMDGQNDACAIRIGAGVKLMDIQRKAAEVRLDQLGAAKYGNRWHLSRPTLERYCRDEGDADPETVVEWNPPQRIKYRKVRNAGGPHPRRAALYHGRDEFFHEFAKSGWIRTPQAAEVMWLAFSKHCLHWLVNHQKPIDMGWCQICPVPLRANWKALLLQRHLKKGLVPPRRFTEGLLRMIADEVCQPEFNALEERYIVRGVEVVLGKQWHRATNEYERAQRFGRTSQQRIWRYTAQTRESIKRSLPWLTRLYAAYLANIKLPGGRLTAVILPSSKASQKVSERRGARVNVPEPELVPYRYDARDTPPISAEEGLEDPNGENPLLRDMPDLRPETEDLRRAEC